MGSTTWTGNPEAVLFQLPCHQCRNFRAVDRNHPFGMMLKPNHACHYVCGLDLDLATYDSKVLAIRERSADNQMVERLTQRGQEIRRHKCQKFDPLIK